MLQRNPRRYGKSQCSRALDNGLAGGGGRPGSFYKGMPSGASSARLPLPSPAPESSSSSTTSAASAVDVPRSSRRHLRHRSSLAKPSHVDRAPSPTEVVDEEDDAASTCSTSSSMSRSKYPPERLPTSDPYEEEETGYLKKREPEMGIAKRVLVRGGWQRTAFIGGALLLALYALSGGFSSGPSPRTEIIVNVTPGGVGGQATNLDAEGRPAAPALGDHDFSEDTEGVTPIGSNTDTLVPVKQECVVPEGKPEHQYALMIDAGSTGSRIHVYKFSYCSPVPVETSTYSSDTLEAGQVNALPPTRMRRPPQAGAREVEVDEALEDDSAAKKLKKRVNRGRWGGGRKKPSQATEEDEDEMRVAPEGSLEAAMEASTFPKAKAGPLPKLDSEGFFKVQPGLSSFAGRPRDAAESLRPLMEEAVKGVPKSLHKCTPIAVKATAGLRLLGATQSQEILDEVESWLTKKWPFPLIDDGVKIMDGSDEGVYAWVTINYVSRIPSFAVLALADILHQLLHLIGPTSAENATAAVMDLGGASTQIVFEPTFVDPSAKLEPGEHVYELNFAAQKHPLYQHSHLGYGLMQGRRSVHNFVAFAWLWQSQPHGQALEWANLTEEVEVPNPCLVKGGKKIVELDPPGREKVKVTFVGTGAGFEACRRVVDVVMAKDALCPVEPCAFGGVYQPKLMDTFSKGPIYACVTVFEDGHRPVLTFLDAQPLVLLRPDSAPRSRVAFQGFGPSPAHDRRLLRPGQPRLVPIQEVQRSHGGARRPT